MQRRIWQIGFKKCGSYSLYTALNKMGVRSVHDIKAGMEFCDQYRNGRELEVCLDNVETTRLERDKLGSFSGMFDGRYFECYKRLLHETEDLFLLNYREDTEAWITSVVKHVLTSRIGPTPRWERSTLNDVNTYKEREEYLHHIDSVPKHFHQTDNSNRLLQIDVTQPGDHYQDLADWLFPFMEVAIPDEPFPHVNASDLELNYRSNY